MPRRIIGLTGFKGAGKDAAAAVLAEYGYQRLALADPLKEIAKVIGWDGSKEDLDRCIECGMLRGRKLLQVLGTEGIRQNIRDDAWLLAAAAAMESGHRYVITDVRFVNEANFVWALGGHVWRIERPGLSSDGHPSEQEQLLITPDVTIDNSGDLAALKQQISAVMDDAR